MTSLKKENSSHNAIYDLISIINKKTSFNDLFKSKDQCKKILTKEDYTFFINIFLNDIIKKNNYHLIGDFYKYFKANEKLFINGVDNFKLSTNWEDTFISDVVSLIYKNNSFSLVEEVIVNPLFKDRRKQNVFVNNLAYSAIEENNDKILLEILKYKTIKDIENYYLMAVMGKMDNDPKSLLSGFLCGFGKFSIINKKDKKPFLNILDILLSEGCSPLGYFNNESKKELNFTNVPLYIITSFPYELAIKSGCLLIDYGASINQVAINKYRNQRKTIKEFIQDSNKKIALGLDEYETNIRKSRHSKNILLESLSNPNNKLKTHKKCKSF